MGIRRGRVLLFHVLERVPLLPWTGSRTPQALGSTTSMVFARMMHSMRIHTNVSRTNSCHTCKHDICGFLHWVHIPFKTDASAKVVNFEGMLCT